MLRDPQLSDLARSVSSGVEFRFQISILKPGVWCSSISRDSMSSRHDALILAGDQIR